MTVSSINKLLNPRGIDGKNPKITTSLYWGQTSIFRIESYHRQEVKILRGARSWCILSPNLFYLYSEGIIQTALQNFEGILINGLKVNNLQYANDTIVFADTSDSHEQIPINEQTLLIYT